MTPIAVVTGASKGIGLAVAERLVAAGTTVVGLARGEEALQAAAHRLDPERFVPEVCDVADEAAVRAVFQRVLERWGGLDVLVNSAGIGAGASLLDGTPAQWRAMWEVNVLGVALCAQLAVPLMHGRPRPGRIVHISSMSGHRVVQGAGMYAATKFAVQAMAAGLRLELRAQGSDIGVATVSPGTVDTRFGLDDDEPGRSRPYPLLQADDVAASVMHLLGAPPHVDLHDLRLRATGQVE